jgi:hypothetical protein
VSGSTSTVTCASVAVREQLAQRGSVFEQARAGQRGVMLRGCDLAVGEAFLKRVAGVLGDREGGV